MEIRSKSLGEAWLRACSAAMAGPGREVSPLVVVIEDKIRLRDLGQDPVGKVVDEVLIKNGKATIETVANTVFPVGLWNPRCKKEILFQRYLKIAPRLRRYPKNRHGLYFERLINFPGNRGERGTNQLAHIIDTFHKGNHRRTALQASLFSPESDLNDARQWGFPCLQQVAFAPDTNRDKLTVTGFYAVQYLFERAYGNYLGLARLGEFVAHELGLTLERITCVSSVAKVEAASSDVTGLLERFGRSFGTKALV